MNDRMGSPTTRSPRASDRSSGAQSAKDKPSISPGKAFTALLTLLIASGSILLLTKPESKVQTQNVDLPTSDNFALTDTEALERFRELDQLSVYMYKSRDVTLIPQYLTTTSPLRRGIYADIRKLLQTETHFEPNLIRLKAEVIDNTPSSVTIRQTLLEQPEFESESGKNVSSTNETFRLVVDWVLQRNQSSWLIHDSTVISSTPAHER